MEQEHSDIMRKAENREMKLQEKLIEALDKVQSLEEGFEKEKRLSAKNAEEIERMNDSLKEVKRNVKCVVIDIL